MSGIQFNNIPGSGLVAPIFTAEFNSGGQYTSVDRIVLIGHKTSTGTMALDTPYIVSSQQEADGYGGPKSLIREMARVAMRNAPALPLYIMATGVSGLVSVVKTITIVGPAPGVGVFDIMGERFQVAVSSTDTATTVASSISALIMSYNNAITGAQMPCTSTSALGVVTLTGTHGGALGNEIDIYVPNIAGNVFFPSGVFTVATTTPGSGTPSALATTLAALGDNPADAVVAPWADATSLGIYTDWSNDVSGRWAWTRQAYGHVFCATVNNLAGLTTLGDGLNDRHLTVLGCYSGGSNGTPTPSYLWVTAVAARLFPRLTDVTTGNIACSHDGLTLIDIKPPRDPSIWPNYSARNALANSGISTWKVAPDYTVEMSKIITTYLTGLSNQPDAVFRDIQAMYQCSEGMKYIRFQLANLFGQKALAHTNPGSLGAIVTPADVKAGLVNIYAFLCTRGVYDDADTFAKLVQVAINPNNPDRLDVFMPIERVNPLDILAINATIYQQFPDTGLLSLAA